jgi:hypothetical protein
VGSLPAQRLDPNVREEVDITYSSAGSSKSTTQANSEMTAAAVLYRSALDALED